MTAELEANSGSSSDLIVEVRDFSYTIPGNSLPLFKNLSFNLGKGQVFCLAGRNGCGKSTLLGLISGLVEGWEGYLQVLGSARDIVRSTSGVEGAATGRDLLGMAMLLQDADLQIIGSTVAEDLLLSAHLTFGIRQMATEQAFSMASRLGLGAYWNIPVHHLSYGQKRKLCLGTALLRKPQLLLLDEPFSGLDYPACLELCNILQECAAQGMALLLSTHDLEPFLSFMERLLLFTSTGDVLCDIPQKLLPSLEGAGVRPWK